MGVLEAPGTSQDEACESCPIRGITDVVVGCSRCICPMTRIKLAPTCSLTRGAQKGRVHELRGANDRWDLNTGI